MFGRIGPMELVLIFSIALIIFGPKKLPEIGKAIGSAIQNFKRHSNSLTESLETETPAAPQGTQNARAAANPETAPAAQPAQAAQPEPEKKES